MKNVPRSKRALLIGIDKYPNLPPDKELHGCRNDVALLHDLLLRRFGFAEENIQDICNEKATRAGILEGFECLVSSVEPNDVVVFQYVGHGSYMRDKKKGSGWTETIVPHDSGRKSTNHPSTDITDVEIYRRLVEPLIRKTPFVTLLFDSCHSGSILRDDFGLAVRGIDPDGDLKEDYGIESAEVSGWLPLPKSRCGNPTIETYVLLASCRANELAAELTVEEITYGAFTHLLCKLIDESGDEDMRTLFRLASMDVTARYPNQHPILEGPQDALIFGTRCLDSPRYLPIKRKIVVDGRTTSVEISGGLASGVTLNSIWAVRPLGSSPQDTDALIEVDEASPFSSHARVIRQGPIEDTFGCFEISHNYGKAALNILVDTQGDSRSQQLFPQRDELNLSGSLNVVQQASKSDVKLVLLKPRSVVAKGDMAPQLGPLYHETWVALGRDGRLLLPPTTEFPKLSENLRRLARYRFGLTLRNINEHNSLKGKVTLQLKRRPKGSKLADPWQDVQRGKDGFPLFQIDDHIACVITNDSDVTVWPYLLEFAENGSIHQRYPRIGGEEQLASKESTKEVAALALHVSEENAFQLAEDDLLLKKKDGNRWLERFKPARKRKDERRKRVTEVFKLFVATERVDLSLLLQTPFTRDGGFRGLSRLLQVRIGSPLEGEDVCAWCTVEEPFVLEWDPLASDKKN